MRGPSDFLKYARLDALYASRPTLKGPARHSCPTCGGDAAFTFPEGGSGCLACGHGFDMGLDEAELPVVKAEPPVRRASPPDIPGYADRDYWWLRD